MNQLLEVRPFKILLPIPVTSLYPGSSQSLPEKHKGGCEDNGNNTCSVHLQRNRTGLSAHHFSSYHLLGILDRNLPLSTVQDKYKYHYHYNDCHDNDSCQAASCDGFPFKNSSDGEARSLRDPGYNVVR